MRLKKYNTFSLLLLDIIVDVDGDVVILLLSVKQVTLLQYTINRKIRIRKKHIIIYAFPLGK